jgi:hypothetical protein
VLTAIIFGPQPYSLRTYKQGSFAFIYVAEPTATVSTRKISFWLTATGALLVNISLVVGEFARTG